MRVGIVGAGMVGSATAFALVMKGVANQIVMVDLDDKRSQAEAMDILHATPFAGPARVEAGSYTDLDGMDVVVIAAGVSQKEGETRLELLGRNVDVFKKVVPSILKAAPEAILLVATNPVDVMTQVTQKIAGIDAGRVIGSGTILDSARFRALLGQHLNISPKSVHAYVIGEHGDSEVLCWSSADAGSVGINNFACSAGCSQVNDKIRNQIDDGVRNAAYTIINGKGGTWYGVGSGIARIIQCIASNENSILSVSKVHDDILGIGPVALSLPSVVGLSGVQCTMMPSLDDKERAALKNSAQILHDMAQKAFESL